MNKIGATHLYTHIDRKRKRDVPEDFINKEEWVEKWSSTFKDFPYQVVVNAVNFHFLNNRSVPTIQQIENNLQEGWNRYWRDLYKGEKYIFLSPEDEEKIDWSTVPSDVKRRMTSVQ